VAFPTAGIGFADADKRKQDRLQATFMVAPAAPHNTIQGSVSGRLQPVFHNFLVKPWEFRKSHRSQQAPLPSALRLFTGCFGVIGLLQRLAAIAQQPEQETSSAPVLTGAE